jgi:DNA-binding MarR family transcriptional regulator
VPPLKRVANRPTWLLSRANARAQALLAAAFAAEGVRGYHFRILAALDEYGSASQADLARHTGVDPSDVVATVNDLLKVGYAERVSDPADRRRNIISISKDGATALNRLDRVVDCVEDELIARLSPAERRTFLRLLAKLA